MKCESCIAGELVRRRDRNGRTYYECSLKCWQTSWRPMVVADLKDGPVEARGRCNILNDCVFVTVVGFKWLDKKPLWLVDGTFRDYAEVQDEV